MPIFKIRTPSRALPAVALLGFALAAHGAPDADTPAATSLAMDLQEYRVVGNSTLPRLAIEQAVYPFLGPGKTVADVEKARTALEQAYHDAGYMTVYVSVPQQKVEHGLVTLKVTEGKVERTRVVNAQYTLPSRIRADVPSTAEGQVPNFNDLQQDMATVNRAPGLHVTPSLASGLLPGTTDIELKVKDAPPLSGWLDYNNAHSANTSPTQLAGGFTYSNLFQRAQSFSLQYQTAPENPQESRAVSGSYLIPMDGYSRYLSLYAVHSRSNVTSASVNVGDQVLFGNNDIVGARYIMPLRPRNGVTQQVTLGLDYKDSKQVANGIDTPLQYWTLDANYGLGLQQGSATCQYGAGAVLGLRGAGSNDTAFAQRRYLTSNSFAVLKLNNQCQQKLPAKWSLQTSIEGQLASEALINNEQFTAGGVGSVRGYLQSEAAGDQGVRASLELHAPAWAPSSWPMLKNLDSYLFFDAAYLRVKDALPAETATYTLDSVGLGFTLKATHGLTLNLNLANPLKDGPLNDLSTSPPRSFTQAHKLRVHFDTRLDF